MSTSATLFKLFCETWWQQNRTALYSGSNCLTSCMEMTLDQTSLLLFKNTGILFLFMFIFSLNQLFCLFVYIENE